MKSNYKKKLVETLTRLSENHWGKFQYSVTYYHRHPDFKLYKEIKIYFYDKVVFVSHSWKNCHEFIERYKKGGEYQDWTKGLC